MSILELSLKERVDEAVRTLDGKRSRRNLRSRLSRGAATHEWTGGKERFMSYETLQEISGELRSHYQHLYEDMEPFEFIGHVLESVTKLTRTALNEAVVITIGFDTNGKVCLYI